VLSVITIAAFVMAVDAISACMHPTRKRVQPQLKSHEKVDEEEYPLLVGKYVEMSIFSI